MSKQRALSELNYALLGDCEPSVRHAIQNAITAVEALEADASPSASEPLPERWTISRDGDRLVAWLAQSAEDLVRGFKGYRMAEWDGETLHICSATQLPASVLRALLGRSEPTRAEVERDVADHLDEALADAERIAKSMVPMMGVMVLPSTFSLLREVAKAIRSGEYRSKRGADGE